MRGSGVGLIAALAFLLPAAPAHAAVSCSPIGAGQSVCIGGPPHSVQAYLQDDVTGNQEGVFVGQGAFSGHQHTELDVFADALAMDLDLLQNSPAGGTFLDVVTPVGHVGLGQDLRGLCTVVLRLPTGAELDAPCPGGVPIPSLPPVL